MREQPSLLQTEANYAPDLAELVRLLMRFEVPFPAIEAGIASEMARLGIDRQEAIAEAVAALKGLIVR